MTSFILCVKGENTRGYLQTRNCKRTEGKGWHINDNISGIINDLKKNRLQIFIISVDIQGDLS